MTTMRVGLSLDLHVRTGVGGATAFNPEDQAWHSLFWASGSSMSGYSDTDSVGTWYNETTEADLTVTGTTFTYDAAHASFNGQAVIQPPSVNHDMAATFSTGLTQTHSIVTIAACTLTRSPEPTILDYDGAGARSFMRYRNPEGWSFWAGSFQNGGTPDTNPHLHVAVFAGTSSDYEVDGTSVASGDIGTNGLGSLRVGATSSAGNVNTGPYALIGIWEGDVTAESWWADFETWVTDTYGITIA